MPGLQPNQPQNFQIKDTKIVKEGEKLYRISVYDIGELKQEITLEQLELDMLQLKTQAQKRIASEQEKIVLADNLLKTGRELMQ